VALSLSMTEFGKFIVTGTVDDHLQEKELKIFLASGGLSLRCLKRDEVHDEQDE
jgi:hypothetical protein